MQDGELYRWELGIAASIAIMAGFVAVLLCVERAINMVHDARGVLIAPHQAKETEAQAGTLAEEPASPLFVTLPQAGMIVGVFGSQSS